MKRTDDVVVDESRSQANIVRLSNGSYILWDWTNGFYRVAHYERTAKKSSDLEGAIALAMNKPLHNSKVKEIFQFISGTDEYAATGTLSTVS